MLDEAHIRSLVGLDVVDANGKSIGNVEFVFNDQDTGRPEWLGIISGTFRHQRVLVPVEGVDKEGPSVRVPWSKERVREAPTYGEKDRGGILGLGSYSLGISEEKERAAYAHYGLEAQAIEIQVAV